MERPRHRLQSLSSGALTGLWGRLRGQEVAARSGALGTPLDRGAMALALVGAAASLAGLAVVAGVMGHNSGQGTDYTTWSWIATGVVWPLGMAASVATLRWRRAAPLAMTAIGLGASFFFVWEYGQAGGVPLAMAGAALLWRRISAPAED